MLDRILAVVVALSLLTACATKPRPPIEPLRLRVLTYNIHHGRGADGLIDLERLADVINRAEPDLVALQEVDVKTKRSGGVDQAAKLGELTGMHVHFAKAIDYQGGQYGNAILSRKPFEDYLTWPLSGSADHEDRSLAAIRFYTGQPDPFEVVFASTHLSHTSAPDRRSQLFTIKQDTFAFDSTILPCILAGDFNFTPDSDNYRFATEQLGFADAAAQRPNPQPTSPAENPRTRIDYVFYRPVPTLRVVEARVLPEPVASDHRPLLVVFEYTRPE